MKTNGYGWIGAALLLAANASQAQTLYKCVAPGAPVSYQTEPCAHGTRTASVRDYRPEPPPSPERLRQLEAQRLQAERDSAFLARRAGMDRGTTTARASRSRRSVAAAVDACADARQRRDAWEQAAGLRRTYDDLRAWNDRVSRACR